MAFESIPPGRPFLDGSPAGTGTRTVTKCVSLPQAMVEYLRAIGDGNVSKGIRIVTALHISAEPEEVPGVLSQVVPRPAREAAYDTGWVDGSNGVMRENPYNGKLERRAYDNGRRDGETCHDE